MTIRERLAGGDFDYYPLEKLTSSGMADPSRVPLVTLAKIAAVVVLMACE